jgi:hypothetical protein
LQTDGITKDVSFSVSFAGAFVPLSFLLSSSSLFSVSEVSDAELDSESELEPAESESLLSAAQATAPRSREDASMINSIFLKEFTLNLLEMS